MCAQTGSPKSEAEARSETEEPSVAVRAGRDSSRFTGRARAWGPLTASLSLLLCHFATIKPSSHAGVGTMCPVCCVLFL